MSGGPTDVALDGVNLELKAPLEDLELARDRLRGIGAEREGSERQRDRYYTVPTGRLKLRRSTFDGHHLILYLRPEDGAVRRARFHRLPVSDPEALEESLGRMLGAGSTVEKEREVWRWREVRIHLDRVQGLGAFVELEARVDRIGDRKEAARRLSRLAFQLEIDESDAIRSSYGEMVT